MLYIRVNFPHVTAYESIAPKFSNEINKTQKDKMPSRENWDSLVS